MSNLVDELALVRAQIKDLEATEKSLRDQVVEQYGAGSQPVGDYLLSVSESKRFDAALAKEVLTESEFESVSVREAKSALVKTLLPTRFAECQKVGGFVVKVTANPDSDSKKITV